jgi:hypothetical protein
MTRYFCDDVSHWRDGEPRTVDVTAQVQLELGYAVEREAYGADVHDVIERVSELATDDAARRRVEIRRILTGATTPTSAPVRLVEGPAGTATDVIRLPEADSRRAGSSGSVASTPAGTETGAVLTGTYPAEELAVRLASADPSPGGVAAAIRRTPHYGARSVDRIGHPWRVVITCPVAEGSPPREHQVVFAGSGAPEPLDVFGIPASSWDLALEESAGTDLAPARGVGRAERLLTTLLLVEIAVPVALVCTAWITGALGMAAREAPGWLLFAVVLAVGAAAFAAIGLFGPRAPDGNVNDALVVSSFYDSRAEMLWVAAAISIALFAGALVSAFAGPLAADRDAIPTPTLSFVTQGSKTTAVIDLAASDVGVDESIGVIVRAFDTRTGTGTTIGNVVAAGALDGRVAIHDAVGVPQTAEFITVLVAANGNGPAACDPVTSSGAGCTVVAVPRGTQGSATSVPATATGAVSPSPSVTPTPSP